MPHLRKLARYCAVFYIDKNEKTQRIEYPGQRMHESKTQNIEQGIPVDERIWAEINSFG